mmetsp:Transcript_32566/g.85581  ORF Transcript_32566/g.85581 Transcript_32566/m.85581 type:complete len:227 (+) Transcript_32566:1235-1915(+)
MRVGEAHRVLPDHTSLLLLILVVEGALAGEEHIGDDTDRPHIHRRVVRRLPLRPQLGRHVRRRAELIMHDLRAWAHMAREAKVYELQLSVLALVLVDHVVELDVAVHDAMVVAVQHCREHLLHQRRRGLLAVTLAVRLHARDERATGAQLHHNVHPSILAVFERLDDLADVGVVELLLKLDLFAQRAHRPSDRVQRYLLQRKQVARLTLLDGAHVPTSTLAKDFRS